MARGLRIFCRFTLIHATAILLGRYEKFTFTEVTSPCYKFLTTLLHEVKTTKCEYLTYLFLSILASDTQRLSHLFVSNLNSLLDTCNVNEIDCYVD